MVWHEVFNSLKGKEEFLLPYVHKYIAFNMRGRNLCIHGYLMESTN